MKNKYITLLPVLLIIILSILSINFASIILFLSSIIIYVAIIIVKIISFYRLKREQKNPIASVILLNIIFFIALGCFLLIMKDLLTLKGASERGQYKSVRVNQKEIERNGGPFKYTDYILQLKEAALSFTKQSDSIKFENKYYEFLTIKYEPKNYTKKILIIASVHGDEPAGALSIPLLLKDIVDNSASYQNTAICIISSGNPVGLANTSRQNGNGCNINRDFELKTQKETNHIISVIAAYKPTLVIDIHENHGEFKTCLFANTSVTDSFGKHICKDLSEKAIELASEPVGMSNNVLKPNGWSKNSTYESILKDFAEYGDLRGYGNSINLPVIALECDQSLPIEKRKLICLNTVKAAIKNIKLIKQDK